MIEIDLSKEQAVDADSKVIQQINLTKYLDWEAKTTIIFFIVEEMKEVILDLLQGFVKVMWAQNYNFNVIWYNISIKQLNNEV